jgi:hypothetical protein
MAGQIIGSLKVLDLVPGTKGHSKWNCLCECGNTTVVRGAQLRKGLGLSCGCGRKRSGPKLSKLKDGDRHGMLVAVSRLEKSSPNGKAMWDCKCDCGGTVVVRGADLVYGNTRSCGCLRYKAKNRGTMRGVYGLYFKSGHAKFGRSADLRMRLSTYAREIVIAGGATVFVHFSEEIVAKEAALFDAAKLELEHIFGELFHAKNDGVVGKIMKKAVGEAKRFNLDSRNLGDGWSNLIESAIAA